MGAFCRGTGWILAALPCPYGQERCGGAGRRCLPRRGRSASFGRAPGFGDLGALTAGGMLPRASFLRARAGLAARRESSALPRDSPFRRGYDGLCPYPLKGLVP